jgi:hypothetical protein
MKEEVGAEAEELARAQTELRAHEFVHPQQHGRVLGSVLERISYNSVFHDSTRHDADEHNETSKSPLEGMGHSIFGLVSPGQSQYSNRYRLISEGSAASFGTTKDASTVVSVSTILKSMNRDRDSLESGNVDEL